MDVILRVLKGPTRVKSIRLCAADAIIGRARGCKIRIPSGEVSRRHCLLFLQDGTLIVEDLESANGTFVNGIRIAGKRVVRPGDQLQIGPLVLTADYAMASEANDPAEVLPVDQVIEESVLPAEEADDEGLVEVDDMPDAELISEDYFPDSPEAKRILDNEDERIPVDDLSGFRLSSDPNALRDILSDIERTGKS